MKRYLILAMLPIFFWFLLDGTPVAVAHGYSLFSSSNPQEEIVKAQMDYQKWVNENAPKVQQDIQRAQVEGKPFEAQKIAHKWQYDNAMKAIEMQEKIWQIQNPRR